MVYGFWKLLSLVGCLRIIDVGLPILQHSLVTLYGRFGAGHNYKPERNVRARSYGKQVFQGTGALIKSVNPLQTCHLCSREDGPRLPRRGRRERRL